MVPVLKVLRVLTVPVLTVPVLTVLRVLAHRQHS